MATFKDNAGKEWSISIDAPKIMRVREECDPRFMLNDTDEDNTYSRMQSDPVLLCRVIFVLCEKQRLSADMGEETFYESVIGDAIDSATAALLKAIVSFTPRRTRELLEAVAGKEEKIQQLLTAKALEKINDPTLEEKLVAIGSSRIDAAVESHLTQLSNATSSPASSG